MGSSHGILLEVCPSLKYFSIGEVAESFARMGGDALRNVGSEMSTIRA